MRLEVNILPTQDHATPPSTPRRRHTTMASPLHLPSMPYQTCYLKGNSHSSIQYLTPLSSNVHSPTIVVPSDPQSRPMYYEVSRCHYAGSCPYAESLWDSSTLEQPAFNISWYILWDLPSPCATQSQYHQFRSWITAVVELSTTLIYEHPGALQRFVCRTKFEPFVNLFSVALGSPVVESPIETCHPSTGPPQQPTEVAHSRDYPAVAVSRDLPGCDRSLSR